MKTEFNKEIESLKKSQTEIKVEMENSESQTKGSEESLKRLEQVEERISGFKGEVANWITQLNKMLNLNKQTRPRMEHQ